MSIGLTPVIVAIVLARGEHRIAPWPGVRSSRQTGHGVRSHRDLGSPIGTHDSVSDTKGRPGDVFPPVRPRSENPLSFRLHDPECPPDRSRKRIKASPRDPAFSGGCEGFAMLSRINLTLSALTNRLNLGTRTLVLNASGTMAKRPCASVTSIMMSCARGWCGVSYPLLPQRDTTFRPCQTRSFPARSNALFVAQPGTESLCLPAQRPTQTEPGQAFEAGQARPAPTRVQLRLAARIEGAGWGYASRQARGPLAAARVAAAAS